MIITRVDDKLYNSLQEKLQGVHLYDGYFTAICPYHRSEPVRSSLFVYIGGHDFKCRSCGKYGSLEALNAKLSGKLIGPSPDTVSSKTQARVPFMKWLRQYGSFESAANYAYKVAKNNDFLISFFAARKVSECIRVGRFGWIDGYYSFPVYSQDGTFVDWVVRSSPSKKNIDSKYAVKPHEKGEPPHLYCPSWERVENSNTVYVPFGILDSWTVYLAGLASITTITGQMINTSMFSDIRKHIVVIPDYNEEVSARKFVNELGWRGKLLLIDWPDGCKDLNDVHMKYGIEKVKELINV